jgi:hypothetical protein
MHFAPQKKFVIGLLLQLMNFGKAGLILTERRMRTTAIYFGITTNVNIAGKISTITN